MLKWLKPQSLPHTCVMSVRPILLQEIAYSIIVSLHQCILVRLPLIYVSTFRGQKELLYLKINKVHSDYYIYQHLNMDVFSRITSTESTILLDTPGWTYVMWRFYSSFHNWHNTGLSPWTNVHKTLVSGFKICASPFVATIFLSLHVIESPQHL
jgi:hypothetical protein